MTDKSGSFDIHNAHDIRELLKGLSSQDFLTFGMQEVAYIRPVVIEGQKAYALHSADGSPLSVTETYDSAEAAAKQSDLETVNIH